MNNLKKVIALSVMVIMVISIAPIGVFAEDTSNVYWDKDIAELTDEFLGYGNSKETPIEKKDLSFVNGGAVSGTASFAGDVVIDDISDFSGVPTDSTRTGTALKLTTNSTSSEDAERTEMVLDFKDSEYADLVKIDFDVLFGTNTEHLYLDMSSDNGSTYIWWHAGYNLYSINGIAPNSSNQLYAGAGRSANVWEHWTITLDMKNGTMQLEKNQRTIGGSTNAEDNTIFVGTTGKLKKIHFYRTNQSNETYLCLDNVCVRSYKEKPLFVDAQGNPAPETGVPATKELNVKLDETVLVGNPKAFMNNENHTFTLEQVGGSNVGIHTVTPVGDSGQEYKIFLNDKLADNTQYKLTLANVMDSEKDATSTEYIFTTGEAPANFGVYKSGYVDGSDNPKYTFNNGDTVKANLFVTNTTGAPQSVTGAIAIYKQTANGVEMCGIQSHTEEIAAGGNFDFSTQLSTTITDTTESIPTGYFAKTFAWKGTLTGAKFIPFDAASYIGN